MAEDGVIWCIFGCVCEYLYVYMVWMCCTCSPSMLLGNVDFNEMDSRAEPYIKVFMLKMCRIRFAWFHCSNYSAMFLSSVCVCVWRGTYIQNLTTKQAEIAPPWRMRRESAPDTIVELKNITYTQRDTETNTIRKHWKLGAERRCRHRVKSEIAVAIVVVASQKFADER